MAAPTFGGPRSWTRHDLVTAFHGPKASTLGLYSLTLIEPLKERCPHLVSPLPMPYSAGSGLHRHPEKP